MKKRTRARELALQFLYQWDFHGDSEPISFDSFWEGRKEPENVFQARKYYVMAAAGVAIFIWFGLFSAIGGAYFQMWQTETGTGALQGSFWYFAGIALVALYINQEDCPI